MHLLTRCGVRVVSAAVLFVVGFATVLMLMGPSASLLGDFILQNRTVLTRVGGVFVIAMGLATMGLVRIPFMYRELRLDLHKMRSGPAGAAWRSLWDGRLASGPCSRILTAAASTTGAVRGAALLSSSLSVWGSRSCCLPLDTPGRGRAFAWIRRHGRAVERVGGSVMIVIGFLMVTGQWTRPFSPLVRGFSQSGWPPI